MAKWGPELGTKIFCTKIVTASVAKLSNSKHSKAKFVPVVFYNF